MRSYLGAVVLALCLSGGTTSQLGCSPCDVGGKTAIEYTGGVSNAASTIYQSSTVDGEYLHFPQGRRYKLMHGLGSTPVSIDIFLSFKDRLDPSTDDASDPISYTEPNSLAPTAGNQAVIEAWNDEFIQIRNDTCANFHVRLVALADPAQGPQAMNLAGASNQ